jgi:hypothetical protein
MNFHVTHRCASLFRAVKSSHSYREFVLVMLLLCRLDTSGRTARGCNSEDIREAGRRAVLVVVDDHSGRQPSNAFDIHIPRVLISPRRYSSEVRANRTLQRVAGRGRIEEIRTPGHGRGAIVRGSANASRSHCYKKVIIHSVLDFAADFTVFA